jgi:hypothetical protein
MKGREYGNQCWEGRDDDLKVNLKEERQQMNKSTRPVSRREVLIGGAAAVVVAGCPFPYCGSTQACERSCAAETDSRRVSNEQDHNEGWNLTFL